MSKAGKISWIPKNVIDELNSIKKEEDIFSDAEAFKKIARYSQIGREKKEQAKRRSLY